MGFIKALGTATSGQWNDMFKEVIKYDNMAPEVLIKKVTTENKIIQNQSRLFVAPGQCVIYTDNGQIKDVITEPGMYFMDTSAPSLFQTNVFKGITETFLETMKRIAYQGQPIEGQVVYFIALTEKLGLNFQTRRPVLFRDPQWGAMEITAYGQYAIQIANPINFMINYSGNRDTVLVSDIETVIAPLLETSLATVLGTLNVSFDEIAAKQIELAKSLTNSIDEHLTSLGLEISKLSLPSITPVKEVVESMRTAASTKIEGFATADVEANLIQKKATSINNEEADIYTKINTAEALKDFANNESGNSGMGATILGVNVGQAMGGAMGGAVAANVTPNNAMKVCNKCNSIILANSKFCSECGERQ